jgi:hypothetical protein
MWRQNPWKNSAKWRHIYHRQTNEPSLRWIIQFKSYSSCNLYGPYAWSLFFLFHWQVKCPVKCPVQLQFAWSICMDQYFVYFIGWSNLVSNFRHNFNGRSRRSFTFKLLLILFLSFDAVSNKCQVERTIQTYFQRYLLMLVTMSISLFQLANGQWLKMAAKQTWKRNPISTSVHLVCVSFDTVNQIIHSWEMVRVSSVIWAGLAWQYRFAKTNARFSMVVSNAT